MSIKNNDLDKLTSNYRDIVGNKAYNNKNVTISQLFFLTFFSNFIGITRNFTTAPQTITNY